MAQFVELSGGTMINLDNVTALKASSVSGGGRAWNTGGKYTELSSCEFNELKAAIKVNPWLMVNHDAK